MMMLSSGVASDGYPLSSCPPSPSSSSKKSLSISTSPDDDFASCGSADCDGQAGKVDSSGVMRYATNDGIEMAMRCSDRATTRFGDLFCRGSVVNIIVAPSAVIEEHLGASSTSRLATIVGVGMDDQELYMHVEGDLGARCFRGCRTYEDFYRLRRVRIIPTEGVTQMTYLTKGGRPRVFDCSDAACLGVGGIRSGELVQNTAGAWGFVIGVFGGGLFVHFEGDIGATLWRKVDRFVQRPRPYRETFADVVLDQGHPYCFSDWQRLLMSTDGAEFRERCLSFTRLQPHRRPLEDTYGMQLPEEPGVIEVAVHDPETDSWGVSFVRWAGVLSFRLSEIWHNGHDDKLRKLIQRSLGDGMEIWFRCASTGSTICHRSLLEARRLEARLLATYDYAWNEADNGRRRENFNVVQLDDMAVTKDGDGIETLRSLLPREESDVFHLVTERMVRAAQKVVSARKRKQLAIDVDSCDLKQAWEDCDTESTYTWSTLTPRTPGTCSTPRSCRRLSIGTASLCASPSHMSSSRPLPSPMSPSSVNKKIASEVHDYSGDGSAYGSSMPLEARVAALEARLKSTESGSWVADRLAALESRVYALESERSTLVQQLAIANAKQQQASVTTVLLTQSPTARRCV